MSFSDEDLKRLKDLMTRDTYVKRDEIFECIQPLLARLEAAEILIALSDECNCEGFALACKWSEARDAWRKAAGR